MYYAIGKRRSVFISALGALVAVLGSAPVALPHPNSGDVLNLPSLEPVGDIQFQTEQYEHRNILVFISTKESADQSKRWGTAIGPKFENKIARWNDDHGQKVLVVPVLDSSVDILSYLPKWALKFLIRQLGGSDRDAILLDYEGTIRNQFQPISNDDTLLVLLGPNAKLQAYEIGEPSPQAVTQLVAAINADVLEGAPSSFEHAAH